MAGYVILLKDVRNSLKLKSADKLNPYIELKKFDNLHNNAVNVINDASGSKFLGKCMVSICIDYHVLEIVVSLDIYQIP